MNRLTNLPEALTFDDVLLVPQFSDIGSRNQPLNWSLGRFNFTTPVIAANMDTICSEKMMKKMDELGGLGIHHRYCSKDEYQNLCNTWAKEVQVHGFPIALSVGTLKNDKERIDFCIEWAQIICVDIAHGDSLNMQQTLTYIRDKGFTGPIIAGNVCTPEATRFLLEHGATIVKVGVGPGSVCTTRIKTGCGFPQLSAIANCSEAGPIIADGGIRTPGDAAKALAAGAKAVMIGGMLAGTDCVPGWDTAVDAWGKQILSSDKSYSSYPSITFRGMASKEARSAHVARSLFEATPEQLGDAAVSMAQGLQSIEPTNAEGVSKTVQCKPAGSTEAVIMEINEGIRSAMSYSGAHSLEEFPKKAKFIRVTNTVQAENHPHFKG